MWLCYFGLFCFLFRLGFLQFSFFLLLCYPCIFNLLLLFLLLFGYCGWIELIEKVVIIEVDVKFFGIQVLFGSGF